jgi:hypothetical protein
MAVHRHIGAGVGSWSDDGGGNHDGHGAIPRQ